MRKFKVFGVPWHIGHQNDLAKLPFIEQYDLLINPYRRWNEESRPVPDNVNFVTHYEPGKYDFAILHIDQQAIYGPNKWPDVSSKAKRFAKGRLYHEVNEYIQDIPKIVINHMTPFHDHIESDRVVEIIKEMVGDNYMVCNSHTAAKQWGWGHPVVHGMDSHEWLDLPKEPRCIAVLSRGGMEKAYRRIFLTSTARILNDKGVPFYWVGMDISFDSFEKYREFIGSSLVFFMPTWQSPRPRARTEAMFSGCCIVTTPYHEADEYIVNGENGFLTSNFKIRDPRVMDNPESTADLIYDLVFNRPDEAIKIGQRGKKTAEKLFTIDNFAKQWKEVLQKAGVWK